MGFKKFSHIINVYLLFHSRKTWGKMVYLNHCFALAWERKYFYCQYGELFKLCMFLQKYNTIYFKINFLDIKINVVQLNSKFAIYSLSLRLKISTGIVWESDSTWADGQPSYLEWYFFIRTGKKKEKTVLFRTYSMVDILGMSLNSVTKF